MEQVYEKTHKSLINRLGNWEHQKSWDEFYRTYWRLIYGVGLKSGLPPEEALTAVEGGLTRRNGTSFYPSLLVCAHHILRGGAPLAAQASPPPLPPAPPSAPVA